MIVDTRSPAALERDAELWEDVVPAESARMRHLAGARQAAPPACGWRSTRNLAMPATPFDCAS